MNKTSPEVAARLDELRRALLDQQRRLLVRVGAVESDLRWFDENVESEMIEEGQERSLAALLEQLDEREREAIDSIEAALGRMRRGTYGVCTACRSPIPLARLRVLPTAETCRACAASAAPPHG